MKLFIGNISFQATEKELREMFEPYGQITRLDIVMDRSTGRSRGFGFVEFLDDAHAEGAMTAVNGKELRGRPLRVNPAKPKSDGMNPRDLERPPVRVRQYYDEGPRREHEPRW